MSTNVSVSGLSVVHKSSYPAATGLAFPDVCKTPTPGGPVPIPYPNLAGPAQQQAAGSKPTSVRTAGNKFARAQELRSYLHNLHGQIWGLPGGNPNRWHQLVDNYVIATAELYKTLSE